MDHLHNFICVDFDDSTEEGGEEVKNNCKYDYYIRCIWKRLDKTLQYIMLKFFKSKNLTKKDPIKFLKIMSCFYFP